MLPLEPGGLSLPGSAGYVQNALVERIGMTTHARWTEWANPDPVALTEFLEACDQDFGHEPIEVTADEVSGFAQPGASRRLTQGSTTVGFASAIRGRVALVRVSRSVPDRDRVLADALSWLAPVWATAPAE